LFSGQHEAAGGEDQRARGGEDGAQHAAGGRPHQHRRQQVCAPFL